MCLLEAPDACLTLKAVCLEPRLHKALCHLQVDKGKRRLQFLLKQAEVFQHFAPEAAEKEKKKYVCAPVC